MIIDACAKLFLISVSASSPTSSSGTRNPDGGYPPAKIIIINYYYRFLHKKYWLSNFLILQTSVRITGSRAEPAAAYWSRGRESEPSAAAITGGNRKRNLWNCEEICESVKKSVRISGNINGKEPRRPLNSALSTESAGGKISWAFFFSLYPDCHLSWTSQGR